MEVSEGIVYLQLQFDCQVSAPLVQEIQSAKQVLEITQWVDLVFSSDRSCDRFTGKPVSQTTGLYYEYQRWYDPTIGRFISQDPFAGQLSDPQSLNPYVYVRDSPTHLVDPTGADPGYIVGDPHGSHPGYHYDPWSNRWYRDDVVERDVRESISTQNLVTWTIIAAAPVALLVAAPAVLFAGTGVCEEDPQACEPPVSADVNPVLPTGGGENELDAFAKTIPDGEWRELTVTEPGNLNRYFGGESELGGHYWTTAELRTSGEAKTILGLTEGNTAELMARGDYPAGSTFLVSRLASEATQVYVDNPLGLFRNLIIRQVLP